MKMIFMIQIMASFLFCIGCGQVKAIVHEGNNNANYHSIFEEEAPQNVKVVNSVFITYSWRIGTNTTPDWEIELIVPEKWIDDKVEKMHLRKVEDLNDYAYWDIKERIKKRGRAWYVPKDISSYDCYYLYPTSIPYAHMLVDKTPVADDNFRVFLSKH